MNRLIRLTHDGNNIPIAEEDQRWCLIANTHGDLNTLCGDMYGISGSGDGCYDYRVREVKAGGVTCERCLEIIELAKGYSE